MEHQVLNQTILILSQIKPTQNSNTIKNVKKTTKKQDDCSQWNTNKFSWFVLHLLNVLSLKLYLYHEFKTKYALKF